MRKICLCRAGGAEVLDSQEPFAEAEPAEAQAQKAAGGSLNDRSQ